MLFSIVLVSMVASSHTCFIERAGLQVMHQTTRRNSWNQKIADIGSSFNAHPD